ncbi:hypothetical protein GIB67_001488, partial [Kingdonia uniflora]
FIQSRSNEPFSYSLEFDPGYPSRSNDSLFRSGDLFHTHWNFGQRQFSFERAWMPFERLV